MDQNITAWFYRFSSIKDYVSPAVEVILKSAWEKPSAEARTFNIGDVGKPEIQVRLERFTEVDEQWACGQITRIQTENIPPETHPDGLKAITLGDGASGLGHTAAFRFHKQSRVMALQFNSRGVGARRFCSYLAKANSNARYTAYRVPEDDQWATYNNATPQRIELQLAAVESVDDVNAAGNIQQAANTLREIADAPYITIEAYMGRRKGSLSLEGLKRMMRAFTGNGPMEVRRAKLKAVNPDMRDGEEIVNLLNPLITERGVVRAQDSDPDAFYAQAEAFLKNSFEKHLDKIKARYGVTDE